MWGIKAARGLSIRSFVLRGCYAADARKRMISSPKRSSDNQCKASYKTSKVNASKAVRNLIVMDQQGNVSPHRAQLEVAYEHTVGCPSALLLQV